jgi:sensor histidine kinase YesM
MEKLYKRHAWPDKKHIVHISCWSVLIFLEVIVAGAINNRYSSFYYYVLFYALNISLFYVHANILMKFANFKSLGSALRFLVILSSALLIYLMLSVLASLLLELLADREPARPLTFDFRYFSIVLYRAAFFLAYGTGFYYLKDYMKSEKTEMERSLENEQLRTQLVTIEKDFLRAQINPHLLYNTLGFIKVNSTRSPEKSDEAIEKLTLIMDYALESNKEEFVPLIREVEHIEYMITLNQLRYGDKLNLKFHKTIPDEEVKILPIILLTLVENLFKHGNLLDPARPASIEIITSKDALIFRTRNLKGDKLKGKREQTGLKNVEQRLEKSYNGNYSFSHKYYNNFFHTELKIHLRQLMKTGGARSQYA